MLEGNLGNFVRQISKEKDVDVSVVKNAIEQSILSASKKGPLRIKNARPDFDLETGKLHIFVQMDVVDEVTDPNKEIKLKAARKINSEAKVGDMIEVEIDPVEFGRIAAQSVRQGILQRLRDAEHEKIYNEFINKVGTVVTGIVQRFDRRSVIVNVGKVETILPQSEIPFGTHYRYGDRIKLYIQDVQKTQRGPEIRVSRTCPELVLKLFDQEVPEIADGTVKIMNIAREAGVRTKIAVLSNNPDVDPVGACVGMKGSRVQMIVRELENEKIDIIPYNSNPEELIKAALNPAEVISVHLLEESRTAQVIVSQNSLSLAIGKKGQNAKLAAKLTGWKIDILSEERRELLSRMEELNRRYLEDFLIQVEGLSQLAKDALLKSAYNTVEKISKTAPTLLLNFTNGNLPLAKSLVGGAKEYLDALEELAKELSEKEKEEKKEEKEEKDQEKEEKEVKAEEDGNPEESKEAPGNKKSKAGTKRRSKTPKVPPEKIPDQTEAND
jgi:N utilization substance protein A